MDRTNNNGKTPTVAIIGGGFSGICAAIQLEKQLGITSYTVFDENDDYGGTWWVNKYPGCACDIQSHFYSYSFELNPAWTKNYSNQSEIHEYMANTARKYGLQKRTKFSSQVKSVEWMEEEGSWDVTVLNKKDNSQETTRFDYIISAVGALRVPHVPEQFTSFKGPIIHSAEWNPDIDLSNKRVALIGSGASAIQILPIIAPKVKELHSYQRKPAWVEPRTQFDIPPWVQQLFATLPIFMWLFRCLIFIFNELHFSVFKANATLNYLGTLQAKAHLKKQLAGKEALQSQLLPDYKLGCKRILVSETYYKAFNLPQVQLHREGIEKVEGTTITLNNGTSQEVDVLILATGFHVQDFFSPMKVTARDKMDVLEYWHKEAPRTYYGVMANAMPNAFYLLGPNTALGHNSVVFMIECQVDLALKVIKEAMSRGAKSVAVKKSVEEAWMTRIYKDMKSTVWGTESCGSWYGDAKGRITTLWPKSCTAYWWETRNLDKDALEFTLPDRRDVAKSEEVI